MRACGSGRNAIVAAIPAGLGRRASAGYTSLLGVPAFQAPVVNVPVPELALFKWTRNRGQTELRV